MRSSERAASGGNCFNPGCSAPDPGLLLFARAKRSNQEKARPHGALFLRSSALGPALSPRDFLSRGPVAHLPVRDPCGALTQSLAVLGRAIRGVITPFDHANVQTHSTCVSEGVVHTPLGRAERPAQPTCGPEGASEGSRAYASGAVTRRMRTPGGQPAVREPRAIVSARGADPGARFFRFPFFARAKKGNPTAVREPQVNTRPQGAHPATTAAHANGNKARAASGRP
jgi:hypothetical protein